MRPEGWPKGSLQRRKPYLRLVVFANLTWTSFERLRSCRLALFRQFDARAFLSERLDLGPPYLQNHTNQSHQQIPVQNLQPMRLRPSQWCALDHRVASIRPEPHLDWDLRSPRGSCSQAALGLRCQLHLLPTRSFPRYSTGAIA